MLNGGSLEGLAADCVGAIVRDRPPWRGPCQPWVLRRSGPARAQSAFQTSLARPPNGETRGEPHPVAHVGRLQDDGVAAVPVARTVVPILPQFSQITLTGSQPAGGSTVETVR